MIYHLTNTSRREFDDVLAGVTKVLAEEGGGLLTEIDLRAMLAKMLKTELRPYRILGACDPDFTLAEIAREVRARLHKGRRPGPKSHRLARRGASHLHHGPHAHAKD